MLFRDEVELIGKLPLLSGVDPSRLRMLCFASDRETFAPGDVIFREGEANEGAYVILSGEVDVHKASDGSHVIKRGSEAGVAIVGQSSMIEDAPYAATVTARTEIEALRLNSRCFMKLMASCPKSSEKIMRALGAQLNANGVISPGAASDYFDQIRKAH
ncbi:cyclic nucleotide-binding domain-containing protein [Rhodobacter maris]|uniref:Cyclic nucleotide-binding domain-containing protein n=1 Tax=Rhodobacter maris TaxID=446682 RepID=A0A285TB84_9RHOB|nr:cyclic nucleotide-binding domain-containing protein [Rhodobacter maris]SOC18303.1 hypothetical protein SAMN05877831_11641 [Rhodobacter maris]